MNAPEKVAVDRARFLGGSDCAAVLGLAPKSWVGRCTPLDVYLSKTGQVKLDVDDDLQDLFDWGKELEPVAIKRLRKKHGVRVTKRSTPRKPNRYFDSRDCFLAAEIDFEWRVTKEIAAEYPDFITPDLVGSIQNGEVKTVHVFASAKFGDNPEDVPVEYAAQAMHGLMVTERQLCMFAVLAGTNRNVDIYWVKRDEDTVKAMRPRLVNFWLNHVLAGVEPEPMNIADVQYLFRKAPASSTEATEEVLGKLAELEKARAAIKSAQDTEAQVKLELGQFVLGEQRVQLAKNGKIVPAADVPIGHHLLTRNGAPILALKMQQQNRLDGDRLKEEAPLIAAQYMKTIPILRFDKPRKSK